MDSHTTKTTGTVNVKTISMAGLMAAVICILGPLSIPLPFSPVPISLTNFVIYFTIYIVGMKLGVVSYFIYLLIGLVGLPVFSGFSSGPVKLFGPTGGYLIGFIFMALICGIVIEKFENRYLFRFIGMVVGTVVCYAFGTAWLAYQAGMSFSAALAAGVIPFIPGDLVKIVLALIFGTQIRKSLKASHLV